LFKRLFFVVGILALTACLAAVPASAQRAKVTYVVPQDFDPPSEVTFRRDRETRTADDQGTPLTGLTLLENGLELHGQIFDPDGQFFRDIVEIHMSFGPFDGAVEIQPESRFGFQLWQVVEERISSDRGPNVRAFRFLKQPNSAPINDNFDPNPQGSPDQSFALLLATIEDDPNGSFQNALFTFQAFTTFQGGIVPEPGARALLAGLLVGGLPLLRRIRRR